MKKVLLVLFSFFIAHAVFAYQTVLVNFPENQGWHSIYYNVDTGEAILQYVSGDDTAQNWQRTVIFHSYKNLNWTNSAAGFMDRITAQMESKNSSQLYKYRKYSALDSVATRCVQKNKYVPTQCEIYRVTKSFEGLMSIHYINKDVQDYRNTYNYWYNLVENVTIYQSYYMDDRILNKATSFEM